MQGLEDKIKPDMETTSQLSYFGGSQEEKGELNINPQIKGNYE